MTDGVEFPHGASIASAPHTPKGFPKERPDRPNEVPPEVPAAKAARMAKTQQTVKDVDSEQMTDHSDFDRDQLVKELDAAAPGPEFFKKLAAICKKGVDVRTVELRPVMAVVGTGKKAREVQARDRAGNPLMEEVTIVKHQAVKLDGRGLPIAPPVKAAEMEEIMADNDWTGAPAMEAALGDLTPAFMLAYTLKFPLKAANRYWQRGRGSLISDAADRLQSQKGARA